MRKLTYALALSLALAGIIGCGGSTATSPLAAALPEGTDPAGVAGIPADVLARIDAEAAGRPASSFEVLDAETGAVVYRDTITPDPDGTYEIGVRNGQGININPSINQVFRVSLVLDDTKVRGYTAAGNPLFYVGDTVYYDSNIEARNPGRARMMSRLGAFDVEYRHLFAADNTLLPECIPGQNPLTIQDVNFQTLTPNAGPYSWSPDGKTFAAGNLQFKLCDLPGMQFGTDLINARLYWVVPGSEFGLPCSTCEVRCIIFDKAIGIYDP